MAIIRLVYRHLSKTMLIAMHENKTTLNEVVVTGYGTQKKVAVTGAISAVSIKDLKKSFGALQKSDTLKDVDISQRPIRLQGAVIPEPVTGMKQYKKYLKKESGIPCGRRLRRSQRQGYLDFLC